MFVPELIKSDICNLDIKYLNFEGKLCSGSIQVNIFISDIVVELFDLMLDIKFPLSSVKPIDFFDFDDNLSMSANNTYSFCYRNVALKPNELSIHSYGLAIDINPILNPYINNNIILPPQGKYIPKNQGTLTMKSPIVKFLKSKNFIWGGDWNKKYVDYHHFHLDMPEYLIDKYS